MGDRSAIEWTDATWNPLRARNRQTGRVGHWCSKTGPKCTNCYAERQQPRFQGGGGVAARYAVQDRDRVELFIDFHTLRQPSRWSRPRLIFPCSMTDLFHPAYSPAVVGRVVGQMYRARHHLYQVLTSRPGAMAEYLCDLETLTPIEVSLLDGGTHILWGYSAGTVAELERGIAPMAALAAAGFKTWLSLEPLLEDVVPALERDGWWFLDGVVCGGESGPDARPLHPDWARDVRDWCARHQIPFDFKQWGEWAPGECCPRQKRTERAAWDMDDGGGDWSFDRITVREGEDLTAEDEPTVWRVGKKAAVRKLDGVTHDGFTALCRAWLDSQSVAP